MNNRLLQQTLLDYDIIKEVFENLILDSNVFPGQILVRPGWTQMLLNLVLAS